MDKAEDFARRCIQRANDGYHNRKDYPSYAMAPWDDRLKWSDYLLKVIAEEYGRCHSPRRSSVSLKAVVVRAIPHTCHPKAQEPDDDALIRRLAVSIAEHRAHINGLQEQYGAGAVPDERCAGIVLNFGDVIDLYARLQAKPETPYCGIVVMPGDEAPETGGAS